MNTDEEQTRAIRTPKNEEEERTRIVSHKPSATSLPDDEDDDDAPRTRTIGGYGAKIPEAPEENFKLTTGWFVVVDGPGKGCSCEIYYGVNSIGRDNRQSVNLDFGDDTISREAHGYVIFDEKTNDFFLQHGGKASLIRVNGAPVIEPKKLGAGDIVEIGSTKLMFVPFCSTSFSWEASET